MVFRDGGKEETIGKLCGATGKFLGKSGRPPGTSNQTNSISLQQGNFAEESDSVTVSTTGKPKSLDPPISVDLYRKLSTSSYLNIIRSRSRFTTSFDCIALMLS